MNLAIKNKQTQAAELFEAAKLQSKMVYGLDDKSISDIELPANLGFSNCIITLNSVFQKRK